MKKFWNNFAKFWRALKKWQRKLRDFEGIVKKFHNNFEDFVFGQTEIENQISQRPLEVIQNTQVRRTIFTPIFSKS